MASGKSLIGKVEGYSVEFEAVKERVLVEFEGSLVVDSDNALRVLETAHDPVLYFPREDVAMEFLQRTDHSSFCPFKGDASYWSLCAGGVTSENAVWSYEDPFEEVDALRNYVAFYPDRVSGLA
ncbi:MAG: DUF427 domain-containing protein [Myxococcota bacterium]|nr:DUF427 domain-containing protein [Myxococcota bacterium]